MATVRTNVYNELADKHRKEYIYQLQETLKYEEHLIRLGIPSRNYLTYKQRLEAALQREEQSCQEVVFISEASLLRPLVKSQKAEKSANKRKKC